MRERQCCWTRRSRPRGWIDGDLRDNVELIEMGEAEGDRTAWWPRPRPRPQGAGGQGGRPTELEALLDGEADGNDTFLEINAGAGGTESCDWASMLARMYVRWAEKKGYTVELQSETRAKRPGSVPPPTRFQRAQRLWLAEIGIGRAPAGAHQPL